MLHKLKKHLTNHNTLLCLGYAVIGLSAFNFFTQTQANRAFLKNPMPEPGIQFADLRPYLKGVPVAGYLTDQDLSPEHNTGAFLQAQYMLAPTILEINNPTHTMQVLDFKNLRTMAQTLRKVHAAPLYGNPYAKVIARKQ